MKVSSNSKNSMQTTKEIRICKPALTILPLVNPHLVQLIQTLKIVQLMYKGAIPLNKKRKNIMMRKLKKERDFKVFSKIMIQLR